MSKPTWLRALSAIAQGLQVINAGIATATHDPIIALGIAALLMAVQTFVNEFSLTTPPVIPSKDA